jgi:hypothetical protein
MPRNMQILTVWIIRHDRLYARYEQNVAVRNQGTPGLTVFILGQIVAQ